VWRTRAAGKRRLRITSRRSAGCTRTTGDAVEEQANIVAAARGIARSPSHSSSDSAFEQ
jgi:hypothetical protein